jgi:hypothetical protein
MIPHDSRARFLALAMVTAMGALPHTLRADAPLPPPALHRVMSPDGGITAVSDPLLRKTVFQVTATKEVLWELPAWERSIFVANDGRHAVTVYGGLNLIPRDADEEMVLFAFWREGKKIGEVRLKDFVAHKSKPRRTVSHSHWGMVRMIDAEGRLVVADSQGRLFRYDMSTGLEIR